MFQKVLICMIFAFGLQHCAAQILVSDFNRSDTSAVPTWTETGSSDQVIEVKDSLLVLNGSGFSDSLITASVALGISGPLKDQTCTLTWAFNLHISTSSPTGFDQGGYGAAIKLHSLGSNAGYAVVIGDPGQDSIKDLRLVKMSNGLQADSSLSTLISHSIEDRAWLGVRVQYDPTTQQWDMWVQQGEQGDFPYPMANGEHCGSLIDSTYTDLPLTSLEVVMKVGANGGLDDLVLFDNLFVPHCLLSFPVVSFSATEAQIDESDPPYRVYLECDDPNGVSSATIKIHSSTSSYGTSSDFYTDPAQNGGSFTIGVPPSGGQRWFDVFPVDDAIFEGDHEIMFTLHHATSGDYNTDSRLFIGEADTFRLRISDNESPPILELTAFLQGPFDEATSTMKDDLRQASLLPTTEPYSSTGYTFVNGGGETLDPSLFLVSGSGAIIDWIILELRDQFDSTSIVYSRAALLSSNGLVLNEDGTLPVKFLTQAGNYYLVVRHRNHLPIMTAYPIQIGALLSLDLSDPAVSCYGTEARNNVTGTMCLWAGDVVVDEQLLYTGMRNDRDLILSEIGGSNPVNISTGYSTADVNMDGTIKYLGASNDRDIILVNIGGSVPTNDREAQLP